MPTSIPKTELRSFLDALFGAVSGHWIQFLGLPSKRTYAVQAIDDAVIEYLTKWGERENVHVAVGLAPRNFGASMRAKADEVSGLVGLWLDIDIKGLGHKKQNLPPTEEDARRLLAEMGVPPSLIVHTGHGLHAWYLFKEPWIFETPEDRGRAIALARAWSSTCRAKAKAHGWDVDATGDLARVMRPPGLWNRKGNVVRTYMPDRSEHAYLLDDLEGLCRVDLEPDEAPMPKLNWKFTLRADANPPPDKFHALAENDARFYKTWLEKRRDIQDDSPSAYDLSLAIAAMVAEWSEQEIVDLLIAHRRTNGHDLKLREDYFRLTLDKAAATRLVAQRDTLAEEVQASGKLPEDLSADPAENLALLQRWTGLQELKILAYGTTPKLYEITLDGRVVRRDSVRFITIQSEWRDLLADTVGKYWEQRKPKQWSVIAQALLNIVREESAGVEASEQGSLAYWLDSYLDERCLEEEKWNDALITHNPARKGAEVFVTFTGFKRYCEATFSEKLTRASLPRIQALGWTPRTVNVYTRRGGRTSRHCYVRTGREGLEGLSA